MAGSKKSVIKCVCASEEFESNDFNVIILDEAQPVSDAKFKKIMDTKAWNEDGRFILKNE